jgi:hypothetical protein
MAARARCLDRAAGVVVEERLGDPQRAAHRPQLLVTGFEVDRVVGVRPSTALRRARTSLPSRSCRT